MSSHDHSKQTQQEQERRFKRVNLAAVAAGALASTSAAVVASFLGVAGTLIGAALASVVSSLAAAAYSGLLASTNDLVRRSRRRPGGERSQPPWRRWSLHRPPVRWLAVGGAAAVMFVVAIGGVTGVEAAIHKPLAAVLGDHDEGNATTSVGAALGASSNQVTTPRRGEPSSSTAESGGSASSSPTSSSTPGGQGPTSTTSPPPSTTALPPSTQPPASR
ncbi:MAG TPA: hypothetical protein VFA45_04405 [Actinomycetes bacterium]|jgi:hypothetical protein|nr:hypothetical protein [Actinomycetes bacterium]